ncbi:hypothetical protein AACT_1590 [Arcobacter acticola]|uniref:Uncharacterized protein n=1 Tax=Arcobacter acticola TaxID=1849015 RepID=A0A6M8EJT2_9BACT|nr:hypothetical protein [Arcobacter acticola]QKE28748.1 hypothetical protein AACT_1590 [Arcobacter acticola]
MTKEEEKEFKQKIVETIMPIAKNMTENQIRTIIQNVEKTNEDLPAGFAVMLFEQIFINKNNSLNKTLSKK